MSGPGADQPGAAPAGSPSPESRLDALDAVRAAAMLLGVVLHACAPYMGVPMAGLVMPVQEPAGTRVPDGVFWLLHAFRVPAFFVVAGFVARELIERRGPAEFLRNRWRRVGLVLLVAYPIVTLAMYPTWLWGWVARGWAGWGHLFALRYGPDLQRAVWGLNQLWFLEYLMVYCLALWAWARWKNHHGAHADSRGIDPVIRAGNRAGAGSHVDPDDDVPHPPAPRRRCFNSIPLRGPGWPSVLNSTLMVVPFACVALWPGWYLDFRNAYLPYPPALVYYGAFFVLGLRLPRAGVEVLARLAPLLLLAGAALATPYLGAILGQVRETAHGPRQGVPELLRDRALLALTGTGLALAWSLGFIGLSARFVRRLGTVGRFLTDASYWVYLTHLVWVGLGVMVLHRFVPPQGAELPVRPEARAGLVAILAIAATLATFALVRHTRVGRWLGARTRA